jgi:hypothetical protein
MTTETQTPTFNVFAKMLTQGDTFYANGTWEIVETVAPTHPGVWVYCRSGEAYYYLGYTTVKVAAV